MQTGWRFPPRAVHACFSAAVGCRSAGGGVAGVGAGAGADSDANGAIGSLGDESAGEGGGVEASAAPGARWSALRSAGNGGFDPEVQPTTTRKRAIEAGTRTRAS